MPAPVAGAVKKPLAGTFLAGAKGRLLPASVPFRFFAAAVVFHVFAWLALLAGGDEVPRFSGGLGWPLAALHLVTLGTVVMSAIGASLQLLPVATRQPIHSSRGPAIVWWLYTPGVAALTLGMGLREPVLLGLGGAAVVVALGGFGVLLGLNLIGARGMPGLVAHGWVALASLVLLIVSALSLVGAYLGIPLLGRTHAIALHVPFAAYGFMGMLVLGLSYILVPMFALSAPPDERTVRASVLLAAVALALAAAAAFDVRPTLLRSLAIGLGAASLALHLRLMTTSIATGMRRQLGRSFLLVRIGWTLLVASLALAMAMSLGLPLPGLSTLFGLTLVGGWLLTFLLGMLQRILPFLASMHVSGRGRRPPTPSSLTAEAPLLLHFRAHLIALGLLALAILVDSAALARVGALVGGAGAVAFAVFFSTVLRRMRPLPAAVPPVHAPEPSGGRGA